VSIAIHIVLGVIGVMLVLWAAISAAVTFVVPRGTPVRLTRWVFLVVAGLFRTIALRQESYRARDRIMAFYAPFALLILPIAWLTIIYAGFTLILSALGVTPVHQALLMSSSSLFTLGSIGTLQLPVAAAIAIEAGLGLGLVALLISYLPTIYAGYNRRELKVTGLEAMAGTPPFAGTMLNRLAIIERLEHTEELWPPWSEWFADIEETHTSIPALAFFRSPQPDRSWVVAAGAVLDAASFVASSVSAERHPEAQLCIRAGYLSLRRIGDYFGLPNPTNPDPDDPISISRSEFDVVFERLREAGAPLIDDQDAAWRSFAGWRVNYDTVLLELASLTIAPEAPWSSDRSKTPVAFTRRTKRTTGRRGHSTKGR
jgi:hypothetical protein